MGALLRIFVIVLLILAVLSIVRGLLRGASQDGSNARLSGKLVKDPICGTYVTTGSISLRQGGQIVHFCSEECRDRYAEQGRT